MIGGELIMVYDINENLLATIYDKSGTTLEKAYNKSGEVVYTSENPTIKVMDYNVGQWYDGTHTRVPSAKDAEYYALQNGMIGSIDPDILVMEEYLTQFSDTGRSALTMLQQYFPYIHEENAVSSVSSGAGRCIASKYPITNYVTHQYTQIGSPRYYDSCTITVDNIPITVVVTHLNYNASSDTSRINQLNELKTFCQSQERFIACGDLNTLDCKNTSGADYQSMIVPLLNAGFHLANCSDFGFLVTYSDEPIATWTGCLDNIITSSNITITDAYVDTAKLTDGLTEKADHMPLIAELQLN